VGARVLAVALCPELVALIASPADSPPDGAGGTGGARRSVGVLAVLGLGTGAG